MIVFDAALFIYEPRLRTFRALLSSLPHKPKVSDFDIRIKGRPVHFELKQVRSTKQRDGGYQTRGWEYVQTGAERPLRVVITNG